MERMTTDDEKQGFFLLNTFYAKDGQAMVRGGGPAPGYEDCTLVDFLSRAATPLGISLDEENPEMIDEIMYDNLQFGPMECDGVLGFLWLATVQATEMRGRLKMIEDILGKNYDLDRLRELVEADRDGRCVVLPVKPGGMVRFAANPRAKHEKVDCINIYADGRIMYGFHETGMKTRWVDEWSEDESEKYVAVDATLEGGKDGKETE